jgi:triacylglycerol esterase/lipase EstA (alpha/beta hydrolase family)
VSAPKRIAASAAALALCALGSSSASARPLQVVWMRGAAPAGTPARYDKVGVLKIGPASARNVLVLEPGTSAGSAYFVPLARWIVSRVPGWQVWSVERRENLLEDQSVFNRAKAGFNRAKAGKASPTAVFNYYLGWLANPRITHHFQFIPNARVQFAKQWGMRVAVEDLKHVIAAARRLGGKVVLGGHSLGGSVVTAYATWNFNGRPGAAQLAGLVYDDGGSGPAESAQQAQATLASLRSGSPWLAFGGIASPLYGLFNTAGSLGVLAAPNMPSLGQTFPLLPPNLKPPIPTTNRAQYGYALNVGTSPRSLIAAQAQLGKGISAKNVHGYHTWDDTGALTPIGRYARMFSGIGIQGVDGTEWYFPQRLTYDTAAVGNGIANPAQQVFGLRATMGRRLPKRLLIYAFGAALGGPRVLLAAQALAKQSHIPMRNLTLLNRQDAYAHNDPAGAYPKNAFFHYLVGFLRKVGRS